MQCHFKKKKKSDELQALKHSYFILTVYWSSHFPVWFEYDLWGALRGAHMRQ